VTRQKYTSFLYFVVLKTSFSVLHASKYHGFVRHYLLHTIMTSETDVFICIRLQKGLHDKGYEEWVAEMIGMREILVNFANLTKSDIVGMRAPFLKPGRNTQYEVSINFIIL